MPHCAHWFLGSGSTAAPAAPAAPASAGLIVPGRFHSSEESSPEEGKKSTKGQKTKKDKKGKKPKDKKPEKKQKDEDEEDEDEADAEHVNLGNEDDDDDEHDDAGSFGDLDGYDELVKGQESKGKPNASVKRPASNRGPKKRPAKKHQAGKRYLVKISWFVHDWLWSHVHVLHELVR